MTEQLVVALENKDAQNDHFFQVDLKSLPYPEGFSPLDYKKDLDKKENEEPKKDINSNPITDNLPRMTKEFLKKHCRENKLYATPQLNDILYLHFKGFGEIENLEEYSGLKCLFLEVNGIGRISGLDNQKQLRCLYLAKNLIKKIENLESNDLLDSIDLSYNMIQKIENLSCLPNLTKLIISHNKLSDLDDLIHLTECPALSVIDIQSNRIEDPSVVEQVFFKCPALRVLYSQGNGFPRKVKNYRKYLISGIKDLQYLDDRPVFPKDRACAEAFAEGGIEAEKSVREEWNRKEEQKMLDSVNCKST
ncbi:Dynein assembly factor 1, axonemal [Cichlidogyrus casuarinus]|uniref:Dynein assembly factor 1, axonemal n=1 Tax=Cichlidogyrus casuarinus TaxID=1844966 RepID=A0ABD2PMM8_9PLAT